jgi:primosomal protein N' (replication factor Y)
LKYISVALAIPVFKPFYYKCEEDVQAGSRVKVPFGNTFKTGYVLDIFNKSPQVNYTIKNIKEVVDKNSLIPSHMIKLAKVMSEYYVCSIGEILSVILPASLRLKREKKDKEISDNKIRDNKETFELSAEQRKVLRYIIKKADENVFARFLLHGVTDSGKTEVYMRIITKMINIKKQVIMLVPEIAITTQLKELLIKRFSEEKIGIWHSKISKSQKINYMRKMQNGELNVLVGPRSAVFATFKNLGAVIIDEEQDSSYKNNSSPYYDAKWVAEKRCEIEKALLIQGSATPNIETLYRAGKGEYEYLNISERIHQSQHPELIIVDMKREYNERYRGGIFSKYLLDELGNTIEKKRQSIIFLNRRGYAPAVVCKSCGENIKCPNCNITLVYHSSNERLNCHWCDYRQKVPPYCPECSGSTFKYSGIGTERVEAALRKLFPEIRVVRMDLDTTSRKGSVESIFKNFKNGKYDIMVGTQIVAKGWDFSNVDLVGVINSDIGLMLPDFRSAERAFTLLKQVEGRTGRGKNRGKIVVQTFNPSHYSIKMLFEKEYSEFYRKEIEIRKTTGFPPFMKLINIVSTHKNENSARKNIYRCRDFIENNIKDVVVLGPAPSPIYKLRDMYRWQMLIKYGNNKDVKNKLKELLSRRTSGRIKVDVDPQDMM